MPLRLPPPEAPPVRAPYCTSRPRWVEPRVHQHEHSMNTKTKCIRVLNIRTPRHSHCLVSLLDAGRQLFPDWYKRCDPLTLMSDSTLSDTYAREKKIQDGIISMMFSQLNEALAAIKSINEQTERTNRISLRVQDKHYRQYVELLRRVSLLEQKINSNTVANFGSSSVSYHNPYQVSD